MTLDYIAIKAENDRLAQTADKATAALEEVRNNHEKTINAKAQDLERCQALLNQLKAENDELYVAYWDCCRKDKLQSSDAAQPADNPVHKPQAQQAASKVHVVPVWSIV